MSNLTINIIRHYVPTVLSQQVLALITWQLSVISPYPPNISSVLSLDMNTPEGAAGKIVIDYFQKIRSNDQVKDKYKARINKVKNSRWIRRTLWKGESWQPGTYIDALWTSLAKTSGNTRKRIREKIWLTSNSFAEPWKKSSKSSSKLPWLNRKQGEHCTGLDKLLGCEEEKGWPCSPKR